MKKLRELTQGTVTDYTDIVKMTENLNLNTRGPEPKLIQQSTEAGN